MAARQPKFDQVLDGLRVRVYATRSEYEVLVGDGEISDHDAFVWCYPKVGSVDAWAVQGRSQYENEKEKT